jgi:hypothetical protein
MQKISARKIVVMVSISLFVSISPLQAAGTSPKLSVNCGQIIGQYDEYGTYGLFKPEVTVKYYGSPLTVTSYFYRTPATKKSETGQNIITFTNKAPSTRYFVSKVDIQHQVLSFNQPQTGYLKFVIEAVDTLKRKTSYICQYKDYYYSSAIVPNNSGGGGSASSGISSRGFNRAACTFDGKKLYGSVYFASSSAFADFSVYAASSSAFADLNVYFSSSSAFTSSCGEWYRTSSSAFADFTVYLASSSAFADFTIYPTSSSAFAGTN